MTDEETNQDQIDRIVKERLDRAKARHAEQLAAVRAELRLTESELTKARERVSALEPFEARVGELQSKIEASERGRILADLGIPSDALSDLEAIYRSRTTGEDEPPSFADFFAEGGAARDLPLLAGYFGSAGDPVSGADHAVSPSAPPVPRALPNPNAGSPVPPSASAPMKAPDFAAWVASPAFRSMTRDQQDQAIAAHESAIGTSFASRWLTPKA